METQKPGISPLRQRMIDDMRMRKLGEKTQYHYLRAVRQFAKYLGRSPTTASVEDLRNLTRFRHRERRRQSVVVGKTCHGRGALVGQVVEGGDPAG